MKIFYTGLALLTLAGCGSVYNTPTVNDTVTKGTKVRIVPLNGETVHVANQATYVPKRLPSAFYQKASTGVATRQPRRLPEAPELDPEVRPNALPMRIPPIAPIAPYQIGIGDVVILGTKSTGSTVEELAGLLAAQNSRQGYTVQDDGAIAIPDLGRIQIANLTLAEAEARVFQRLVENQLNPSFSLEVSEFNSKNVSVGGAVGKPVLVPITLQELTLERALFAAGGIQANDPDYATIRIYREGELYQIPVSRFFERSDLRTLRLREDDSVYVDTAYDLGKARDYFAQQLQLRDLRDQERQNALSQMDQEIGLRQRLLSEEMDLFDRLLSYGAETRDYAYIAGEVSAQGRFELPFDNAATLADAIYDKGGLPNITADASQIYVLRKSPDPKDFGAVTAWHLDATNAGNLTVATTMELRPNDIVYVSEHPVTRWNRTLAQILPTLAARGNFQN